MTTDHRAATTRRMPQLIPRRLLRGKAAHHPVVPGRGPDDETGISSCVWPMESPRSRDP